MQTPKQWYCETVGQKVVEALRKNNFNADYAATKEEARQKVLSLVGDSRSIGIGGSVTIKELGVIEQLAKEGKEILDHTLPNLKPEESLAIRHKQLTCDCFLCSTNAVTLDGQLVNVDGTGNRVGAMGFGPGKVIVVAGINKAVKDLQAALERIETRAAPLNNKRLNRPNPCTQSGVCLDCASSTRICNITTIIRRKPPLTNINVIVVGEELGY
ncbi:MAG: lactate utilization protein [Peptococcaceae bacterium]|jgi:L-lactate utilization protein LutB|nr:lactate utilization protein [Peptococcaceae bacterium]MDH7524706.1 lactate utilization protein [Peptococcaceae bacterium]